MPSTQRWRTPAHANQSPCRRLKMDARWVRIHIHRQPLACTICHLKASHAPQVPSVASMVIRRRTTVALVMAVCLPSCSAPWRRPCGIRRNVLPPLMPAMLCPAREGEEGVGGGTGSALPVSHGSDVGGSDQENFKKQHNSRPAAH